MLGEPLGGSAARQPPPPLGGGGIRPPPGGVLRWERRPAPLALSRPIPGVCGGSCIFFFPLLEVAMATVCWERDGEGPGRGCPWAGGDIKPLRGLFAVFSQEKKIVSSGERRCCACAVVF